MAETRIVRTVTTKDILYDCFGQEISRTVEVKSILPPDPNDVITLTTLGYEVLKEKST